MANQADTKTNTKAKVKKLKLTPEEKKAKRREYMREYLKRPGVREKQNARMRDYYQRNKEMVLAKHYAWQKRAAQKKKAAKIEAQYNEYRAQGLITA